MSDVSHPAGQASQGDCGSRGDNSVCLSVGNLSVLRHGRHLEFCFRFNADRYYKLLHVGRYIQGWGDSSIGLGW